MKAAAFALAVPATVDEAVGILSSVGPDAALLAGGQSLLPLLAARQRQPKVLVDMSRIPGLAEIGVEADGTISIGAMVRQRSVERDPRLRIIAPLLSMAIGHIACAAVRNQGTIGGSLAFADPAAELPAAACALDALMIVAGPGGTRQIAASSFFVGPNTTVLAADEMLIEIRIPAAAGRQGVAFEEMARRAGDAAVAAAAVTVRVDQGLIAEARIAMAAVDETPVRARQAERLLAGEVPSVEIFAAAAADASAAVSPITTMHATAAYRRYVIQGLVRRALATAARHAGGAS